MSEDSSQEKKHDASDKRIEDMKKEGKVLRSRDFLGAISLIASSSVIIFTAPHIARQLFDNFVLCYHSIAKVGADFSIVGKVLKKLLFLNILILIPIFIVVFVAVLMSSFLFGGWNFSMQAVHFKFERLNPVTNLGRIFSPKLLIEVTKSIFKLIIFFIVLSGFIYSNQDYIFHLIADNAKQTIVNLVLLIERFIITFLFAVVFIALCDALYSWFDFKKQSKMTTQEVKDESKEMEGSPEAKQKMKGMQLAILRNNMNKNVPEATVVVTNPTHYSIAIKYKEGDDAAPKVVAKGKGELAHYIKSLAIKHRVPLYDAPFLARAIYRTSKVGQEIHTDLYMPVAIVLSYIYQLRRYQYGEGPMPERATDLQIPKEMIYSD